MKQFLSFLNAFCDIKNQCIDYKYNKILTYEQEIHKRNLKKIKI